MLNKNTFREQCFKALTLLSSYCNDLKFFIKQIIYQLELLTLHHIFTLNIYDKNSKAQELLNTYSINSIHLMYNIRGSARQNLYL